MVKIRAFRAVDEPETCHAFLAGHRKVLEEFNLENISTNTPKWIRHENSFVVVAEFQNEIIAGARMQVADNSFALPVSDAVAHFDPKIDTLIANKMNDGGASELCGLWNSRKLPPNLGITMLVSMAAVSLAQQIQTKNVFAICAGYTLRAAMKMGFAVEKSVGNNGEFVYPNSKYTARVLSMNGYSLENTIQEYKQEIELLRKNGTLLKTVLLNGDLLEITYDVRLKIGSFA